MRLHLPFSRILVFVFTLLVFSSMAGAETAGVTTVGNNDYGSTMANFRVLGHAGGFMADDFYCAGSDPANGYAYFVNRNGNEGVVGKFEIGTGDTAPTQVGEAVFDETETNVACGVIDRQRGYGYFGTLSGSVVMISLGSGSNPPQRIGAVQLTGVEMQTLETALIDEAAGYLYFASSTYPSVIHKLAIGSGSNLPTEVGSLTLNAGENDVRSGAIDTTNGFAYFGGYSYAFIAKVALGSGGSAPTRVGAIATPESHFTFAALDTSNGFGYFGSEASVGGQASFVKVELGTGAAIPTRIGSISIANIDMIGGLVLDTANQHAYLTGGTYAHLAKLSLGAGTNLPAILANIELPFTSGVNRRLPLAEAVNDGYLVIGVQSSPSQLVKASVGAGVAAPSVVQTVQLTKPETSFNKVVLDTANGHGYTLSYPSGTFTKFSMGAGVDAPARLGATIGSISYSLLIDPANGYGYEVLTSSLVAKYTLGSGTAAPSYLGFEALSWGAPIPTYTSFLDTNTGYIYIASMETPAKVYKTEFDPATDPLLRQHGVLTLNTGENQIVTSVLDQTNGYAYLATMTTPPKIVKIATGSGTAAPTRIGAIDLDATDSTIAALTLDEHGGYLYAMSMISGAMRILKIQAGAGAALPVRIGATDFPVSDLTAAALSIDSDAGFGYLALNNSVIKTTLGTGNNLPAEIGTATLTDYPSGFACSTVDATNGILYLGTSGRPGQLVKCSTSWRNTIHGTKVVLTEKASVNDLRLYSHQSGGNLRMAVYDDNGSVRSLKWQSNSIVNYQTGGWITAAISSGTPSALVLEPGTYWLAFNTDSANDWESFATAGAGNGFELYQSDGPFASTITNASTTDANGVFSQYLSYTGYSGLTVASAYGSPSPAVGATEYLDGSTVNASVTSPVSGGPGIQYVCTGYTGTGNAPSGSGTSCSFAITQASTLTWNWKTQYLLTTAVSPSGAGSVAPASGTWIDSGASQSVQASNNTGWQFSSWSGALSGATNPQNLTMNAAKSVTANFNPQLSIASAYGAPSPAVGTSYPAYNAIVSASVASPVSGGPGIQYVCTGYTGTGSAPSGSGTSCSFAITQPSTLTWNWKVQYQLTTAVSPTGGGLVTPANGTWFDAGTVQSMQAVYTTNWRFASWSGSLGGSANPTNLTMDSAKSVTANFDPILLVTSAHGSPTPGAGSNYPAYGSTVNASVASPVSGGAGIRYLCTGYTGTGSAPSGSGTSCSFIIDRVSSLTWNWKTQYLLTTTLAPAGTGITSPADGTWIDAGTLQSIEVLGNTGWALGSWSGDLTGAVNPGSLTMDSSKSVVANMDPALTVVSNHGMPMPSVGTWYLTYNMTINASIDSPVAGEAGIRSVCTGHTGTGDAPSGSGTACTFILTQPSTLTWNWKTQYELLYNAAPHGRVEGDTSQWVDSGASGTAVEAVADTGYTFMEWSDLSTQNPRTDTGVGAPLNLSANFADITPPTSSLSDPGDTTFAAPSVSLPFTTTDEGSGVAMTSLWVKTPVDSAFHDTGLVQVGTSGVFDYTFAAGDGVYQFATKAGDAVTNFEPDPVTTAITLIVNTEPNSTFEQTLSDSDGTLVFPMTNDLDVTITITGALPGGTITVSRGIGDSGPAGLSAASLLDEHLTIVGNGLGTGWTATITWGYDPASDDAISGILDTVFQIEGDTVVGTYPINPSETHIIILGVTSFSDWYAGDVAADVDDWGLLE